MTYADTAAVWGFVIPKPFAAGVPAAFSSFIKTFKQRVGNRVQGRGLDLEGHISWVCNTWQPVYSDPLRLFPSATAAGVSRSPWEKTFLRPIRTNFVITSIPCQLYHARSSSSLAQITERYDAGIPSNRLETPQSTVVSREASRRPISNLHARAVKTRTNRRDITPHNALGILECLLLCLNPGIHALRTRFLQQHHP